MGGWVVYCGTLFFVCVRVMGFALEDVRLVMSVAVYVSALNRQ